MKYLELRKRQEQAITDFDGIFYAFNKNQFEEGMIKVGLNMDDTKEILSLGAGGYIVKDKRKQFERIFEHYSKTLKEQLKKKDFLLDALTYELQNHEFCITYSFEQTFDALGITLDDIKELEFGMEVLNEAKNKALECC